ncbi:MAG: gliding motility lipoprotein GldH [Bacteroidetes bacterium]|nr:gliding motility lipoprotein GldH [Bacteroidota bacterium]
MRGQFSKLFFILGVSIILHSCNLNGIYNESITIDEKGWYKNDLARFEVAIDDTLQSYDFYINIRNTTEYRYSNLYIFLNTRFPNNNISRDTIEFVLADIEGRWLGKGWGAVKENSILLSRNMRFPLKGIYEFKIQQAMRVDTLDGISDVGIQITPSE